MESDLKNDIRNLVPKFFIRIFLQQNSGGLVAGSLSKNLFREEPTGIKPFPA